MKSTPATYLLMLGWLAMSLQSCAQNKVTPLEYQVRIPLKPSDHPPLLILLHGFGSDEHDLFSMASSFPEEWLVISARGPVALGQSRYAWYHVEFIDGKPSYSTDEAESARQQIIGFIDDMRAKFHTDPSKTYLCGFSQGAIMSYSVALTRPDLVTGIAAMSGRLLDEIKPIVSSDPKLKSLRIHIAHGTEDQKIKYDNAVEAEKFLRSIGLKPALNTYKAGHEINGEMLSNLLIWLGQ